MRISDWSSDVCSSDLRVDVLQFANIALLQRCGRKSCDGHRDGLCAFFSAASRDDDVVERVASWLSRPCRPFLRNREIRDSQQRRAQQRAASQLGQIGRASCRDRVCQYVSISVVAVSLKKKTK